MKLTVGKYSLFTRMFRGNFNIRSGGKVTPAFSPAWIIFFWGGGKRIDLHTRYQAWSESLVITRTPLGETEASCRFLSRMTGTTGPTLSDKTMTSNCTRLPQRSYQFNLGANTVW
jgi:hypothetical protein